jgi:glycosyltransferase involved in cell wall biosynthesis
MPLVSVVMPFFNSEKFIEQAISSVRKQTFSDLELIAVDDGSTDSSAQIVARHAAEDTRIRLVSAQHKGVASARNLGIQAACGRFIASMDADDISLATRLSNQVEALNQNPKLIAIGGSYDVIDEIGRVVYEVILPTTASLVNQTLQQGGCPLCQSATTIRLSALQAVGGYRPNMTLAADYDLWLRLANIGALSNLPDKVLQFRVQPSSVTYANSESQFAGLLKAIIWRKGITENLDGKTVSELLELAAGTEEVSKFLVSRAAGYPVAMAEMGYFTKAIELSTLFIKHVAEQKRTFVLWQFMMRSVAAAAEKRGRAAALRLLLQFLSNRRLAVAALERWRELQVFFSALLSKPNCGTTQRSPEPGLPTCGHIDSVSWADGGKRLVVSGWARFHQIGRRATFLVHLLVPASQASIVRTIRPDLTEAFGSEYLFSGFRITISGPLDGRAMCISVVSEQGKFSLDDSMVTEA